MSAWGRTEKGYPIAVPAGWTRTGTAVVDGKGKVVAIKLKGWWYKPPFGGEVEPWDEPESRLLEAMETGAP